MPPILKIADPKNELIVVTTSCLEGLGEALMLENVVVAYESMKLKTHENNYVVYDLELPTIIHAIKMWRQYLLGNIFTLLTNHISLKYLFIQLDFNAR